MFHPTHTRTTKGEKITESDIAKPIVNTPVRSDELHALGANIRRDTLLLLLLFLLARVGSVSLIHDLEERKA